MRVILDTNVVLDVLLARRPFVDSAARVFGLIEKSQITGLICATTVTTVDYLLTQSLSPAESHQALRKLLELFEVAPVNRPVIEEALESKIVDFEDAALASSGKLAGAEAIITRNMRDFRNALLKVLGPDELLSAFNKK